MAKNLTIGMQFNLDQGWMGGAYYMQNVLMALGTLDEEDQPHVVVIAHDRSSFEFLRESGYENLSHYTSQQVFTDPRHRGIDLMFPHPMQGTGIPTLTWIPDFQEQHMQHLFSREDLDGRRVWHESCFACEALMLSSESALSDLRRFYPDANVPTFVVPFASFLPAAIPQLKKIRGKYALPERYFFAPNQFWMHKNHVVILAALRELKERGVRPKLCFSGKEFDSRAPGYADFLRHKIEQWGLGDQITFLGFMPRDEQISVMREAIAVVQPSRFEGWSTVVEDAKALNQFVIASSLDVHQEQLDRNFAFFDPSDFIALADIMEAHWRNVQPRVQFDYDVDRRRFGERLQGVFALVVSANVRGAGPLDGISEISQSLRASDITGLYPEVCAPRKDLGIHGNFCRMRGPELSISKVAISEQRPILKIRFRNTMAKQAISLKVGDHYVCRQFMLGVEDASSPLEMMFDLSRYNGGKEDINLTISQMDDSASQPSGLLIEQIDLISVARRDAA